MDGLNNEERIAAWLAGWSPSFDGKAIVDEKFTFRAVNQQFCAILGVSPAELVNNTFSDLTPPTIRELDVKNANLVKEGVIDSYLLPKEYEFPGGKRVKVKLLVNGVYHPENGKFMFFLSTIMAIEPPKSSTPLCQMPTGLLNAIDRKKVTWGVLTIIGASLVAAADKIIKLIERSLL